MSGMSWPGHDRSWTFSFFSKDGALWESVRWLVASGMVC